MEKNLREIITPEYLGIIWVTHNSLNSRPPHYDNIDYFFDGLLTKTVNQPTDHKTAFFLGKSFGKPFFLAHFEENNPVIKQEVENTLKMAQKIKSRSKKILVISDKHLNLKNKFKEFELLNI